VFQAAQFGCGRYAVHNAIWSPDIKIIQKISKPQGFWLVFGHLLASGYGYASA